MPRTITGDCFFRPDDSDSPPVHLARALVSAAHCWVARYANVLVMATLFTKTRARREDALLPLLVPISLSLHNVRNVHRICISVRNLLMKLCVRYYRIPICLRLPIANAIFPTPNPLIGFEHVSEIHSFAVMQPSPKLRKESSVLQVGPFRVKDLLVFQVGQLWPTKTCVEYQLQNNMSPLAAYDYDSSADACFRLLSHELYPGMRVHHDSHRYRKDRVAIYTPHIGQAIVMTSSPLRAPVGWICGGRREFSCRRCRRNDVFCTPWCPM
ncbi:hypothetical protein BC826DRAFT_39310 [Russula brevipes]|nr:hypothetical protein BC826DRAFT_39310 [Russula brevipes]